MFPVDIFYLKEPWRDYIFTALQIVAYIHKFEQIDGDILIFLTSL